MNKLVEEFRNGIFSLHTRRFGTVAELIMEKKYGLLDSKNQFHDRTNQEGEKIEIKYSKLLRKNKNSITEDNLIEECLNASTINRALAYETIKPEDQFDSNIQQVKTAEFDILYYGIFFVDKIAVFKIRSEEVKDCPGYSDFQHKGNQGEGQFHINNRTLDYHMSNHFKEWISYEEVYEMFSK